MLSFGVETPWVQSLQREAVTRGPRDDLELEGSYQAY